MLKLEKGSNIEVYNLLDASIVSAVVGKRVDTLTYTAKVGSKKWVIVFNSSYGRWEGSPNA